MAKRKVRLADNIARVIFIDDEATPGATLGTNLFLPNGEVATPQTLLDYLGNVSSITINRSSSGGGGGGGGVTAHALLTGLTLGDDHPQYYNDARLPEAIDDRVAALLQEGTNITLVYDDTLNTLTINSTGGSGSGLIDGGSPFTVFTGGDANIDCGGVT